MFDQDLQDSKRLVRRPDAPPVFAQLTCLEVDLERTKAEGSATGVRHGKPGSETTGPLRTGRRMLAELP